MLARLEPALTAWATLWCLPAALSGMRMPSGGPGAVSAVNLMPDFLHRGKCVSFWVFPVILYVLGVVHGDQEQCLAMLAGGHLDVGNDCWLPKGDRWSLESWPRSGSASAGSSSPAWPNKGRQESRRTWYCRMAGRCPPRLARLPFRACLGGQMPNARHFSINGISTHSAVSKQTGRYMPGSCRGSCRASCACGYHGLPGIHRHGGPSRPCSMQPQFD